ncbi:hypothetical protein ACHAQH_003828 [Verticillium albo-atrum]
MTKSDKHKGRKTHNQKRASQFQNDATGASKSRHKKNIEQTIGKPWGMQRLTEESNKARESRKEYKATDGLQKKKPTLEGHEDVIVSNSGKRAGGSERVTQGCEESTGNPQEPAEEVKLVQHAEELQPSRKQRKKAVKALRTADEFRNAEKEYQKLADNLREPGERVAGRAASINGLERADSVEHDEVPEDGTVTPSQEHVNDESDTTNVTSQSNETMVDTAACVHVADGHFKILLDFIPSLEARVTELSVETHVLFEDIEALRADTKALMIKHGGALLKLRSLRTNTRSLKSDVSSVSQALRKEPFPESAPALAIRVATPIHGDGIPSAMKREATKESHEVDARKRVKRVDASAEPFYRRHLNMRGM